MPLPGIEPRAVEHSYRLQTCTDVADIEPNRDANSVVSGSRDSSVLELATRQLVFDSPPETAIFFCPDRLWGPPNLLSNGYRKGGGSFIWGKTAEKSL
jgi:hypothetical protein